MKSARRVFKFGLKRLLINTAVVALVAASAQFPTLLILLMLVLGWLIVMAMLVIACSAIGRRKTFAIGFSIPVVCYALAWCYSGKAEFDGYKAYLPTTILFHEVIGQGSAVSPYQILKWHMFFALGSGYLGGHLALWTGSVGDRNTRSV